MSESQQTRVILGLTGSLGSGKSFVSSLLSRAQAKVICADELAREAVAPGGRCLDRIVEQFGPAVLKPDGTLDRSALARIVFADSAKRHQLEQIIHPVVHERALNLLQKYGGHPLIVLDVPLLFESGFDSDCDKVVVVRIDEEVRVSRLLRDRAMTRSEIEARLAAQMPQKEKVALADFLVDNSGSRQETTRQVSDLLHQLFPQGLPYPITEPMPFQDR